MTAFSFGGAYIGGAFGAGAAAAMLGQANGHLPWAQRQALEEAEEQIARYLGRHATRIGIELTGKQDDSL